MKGLAPSPDLEVQSWAGTTQHHVAGGVIVVQSLSRVRLFATPGTIALPGFPVLHHLSELAQTHVH